MKLRPDSPVGVIKPMLAFPYCYDRFDSQGMAIQPKLDGVRAMYQNGNFVSRDGKVWMKGILPHLEEELASYNIPPNAITDGELYLHGLKLQEINARVTVNRTQRHKDVERIEYHIFDLVSPQPFLSRYVTLHTDWIGKHTQKIQKVPTHVVTTPEQADILYNEYRAKGFEGIMYRDLENGYSLPWFCSRKDNRSWSLMKRKGGFDVSGCKIIGIFHGTGKFSQTMGYVKVTHPEIKHPFDVGSGFSDFERDLLWRNRVELEEASLDVKFDEYSKDGSPLRLRATSLHLPTDLANQLV